MSRSESQSRQAVSTRGLSEGGAPRSKKKRFLRWTMRRRQCRWMIGINLLLMGVLIATFLWMFFATKTHREEMRRLKKESRVLKRVANNITFLYCKFKNEDPTQVGFSTDLCGSETVDYAKVVRFHYLNGSQPACLNLYEEGPCHEYLESERKKPENASRVPKRLKKIEQCRGLLGVDMPKDSYVSADQGAEIIASSLSDAPAVDNADNLVELLNTVVLASELVVKCPRCKQLTDEFWIAGAYMPQLKQLDGKPYNELCGYLLTKIDTEVKGWPAVAQRCDRFGVADSPDMCSGGPHPRDMTKLWEQFVLGEEGGNINSTTATSAVPSTTATSAVP